VNPLLVVLAGVVALSSIATCVAMKPETRLIVAVALCVPQVHVASFPISVAQMWIVLIGATSLLDQRVRVRERALLLPAGGLALTNMAYVLWSPRPNDGLSASLGMIVFLILAWYAIAVGREQPRFLASLMKVVAPWVIIEAALVVLFRWSQPLEMAFLRSSLADVLVGPSASGLFNGFANNVFDPNKAGGLFVNANVASMFLGVGVFFLAILAKRSEQRRYWLMALIAWGAIFATGSKEAVALAILLPLVACTMPRISTGTSRLLLPAVVFVTLAASLVLPDALARLFPEYSEMSVYSFGTRSTLWEAGAALFARHPLLGLGFGGWSEQIGQFTGSNELPPHNLIVAAWANAGLLAAILSVAFIVVVVTQHMNWLSGAADMRSRRLIAYCLCAWLWVFVHGMGDNTVLYGESKTMGMLAILMSAAVVANREGTGATCPLRPTVTQARTQGKERPAMLPVTIQGLSVR
jgi:O-antigen ligase